ncbi:hypothetical protein [Photorhabdus aballayi]
MEALLRQLAAAVEQGRPSPQR